MPPQPQPLLSSCYAALLLCTAVLPSSCTAQDVLTYTFVSRAGTAVSDFPFTLEITGQSSSVVKASVAKIDDCTKADATTSFVATAPLDASKRATFTVSAAGNYTICAEDSRFTTLRNAGSLVVHSLDFAPRHLFTGVRSTITFSAGTPDNVQMFLSARTKCSMQGASLVYGPTHIRNRTAEVTIVGMHSGYVCLAWPDPDLFDPPQTTHYVNLGRLSVSEPFTFFPTTALRNDNVTLEVDTFGYGFFARVAVARIDRCAPADFAMPPFALAGEFGVEASLAVRVPAGSYLVCVETPVGSGQYIPAQGSLQVNEYTFSPTTLIAADEERVTLGGAVTSQASLVSIHQEESCLSARVFGPSSTSQYEITLVLNSPGTYYLCVKKPGPSGGYILAGNLTVSAVFTVEGVEEAVRGIPEVLVLSGGSPPGSRVKLADDTSCQSSVGPVLRSSNPGGTVVFSYLHSPGTYAVCVETVDRSRWLAAGTRVVRDYAVGASGAVLAGRPAALTFERTTPAEGLDLSFVHRPPLTENACLLDPSQIENGSAVHARTFPPGEGGDVPAVADGTPAPAAPASDGLVFPKPGFWDLCSSFPTPSLRLTSVEVGVEYSFLPTALVAGTPAVLMFGRGVPRGTAVFLSESGDCQADADEQDIAGASHPWAAAVQDDGTAFFMLREEGGGSAARRYVSGEYAVCVGTQQFLGLGQRLEYVAVAERLTLVSVNDTASSAISQFPKHVALRGYPLEHSLSYTSVDAPVDRSDTFRVFYKVLHHPLPLATLSPSSTEAPAAPAPDGTRCDAALYSENAEGTGGGDGDDAYVVVASGETSIGGTLSLTLGQVGAYYVCAAVEVSPYLRLFQDGARMLDAADAAAVDGVRAGSDLRLRQAHSSPPSEALYYWLNVAEVLVAEPIVLVTPAPPTPPVEVTLTQSESATDAPETTTPAVGYFNKQQTLGAGEVLVGVPFDVKISGSAVAGMSLLVTSNETCGAADDLSVEDGSYVVSLNTSLEATLVLPRAGLFHVCASAALQWVRIASYTVVPLSVSPAYLPIGLDAESAFAGAGAPREVASFPMQISHHAYVGSDIVGVSLYLGDVCPAAPGLLTRNLPVEPVLLAGPFALSTQGFGFLRAHVGHVSKGRDAQGKEVPVTPATPMVLCGQVHLRNRYVAEHFFAPSYGGVDVPGSDLVTFHLRLSSVAGYRVPASVPMPLLGFGAGAARDANSGYSAAGSTVLKRFTPWRVNLTNLMPTGGAAVAEVDALWDRWVEVQAAAAAAAAAEAETSAPESMMVSTPAPASAETREARHLASFFEGKDDSVRRYVGVYVSVVREGSQLCTPNDAVALPQAAAASQGEPLTVRGGERRFVRLARRNVIVRGGVATPLSSFDPAFEPDPVSFSLDVPEGTAVKVCTSLRLVADLLPAGQRWRSLLPGGNPAAEVPPSVLDSVTPPELAFYEASSGVFTVTSFFSPSTVAHATLASLTFHASAKGVHNATSLRQVEADELLPISMKISGHPSCNTTVYGPVGVSGGEPSESEAELLFGEALHTLEEGYVCMKGGPGFMVMRFKKPATAAPTPSPDLFATPPPADVVRMERDAAEYVEVGTVHTVRPFVVVHPATLTLLQPGNSSGAGAAATFLLHVHVPAPPSFPPPPTPMSPPPPAGLYVNKGAGSRVKVTTDDACLNEAEGGHWQRLLDRNVSFTFPRHVTGKVHICVVTEDGSNWLRSGTVILLAYALPFDTLVADIDRPQIIPKLPVASGYLLFAAGPECGTLGAGTVHLTVPIINATAVVHPFAVQQGFPERVWGCVSSGGDGEDERTEPAGIVSIVPKPQLTTSYAPAVYRNQVAVGVSLGTLQRDAFYVRVLHTPPSTPRPQGWTDPRCDQATDFLAHDAANGDAGAAAADYGLIGGRLVRGAGAAGGTNLNGFTPYRREGTYTVCVDMLFLSFRLRVSAGTFDVRNVLTVAAGNQGTGSKGPFSYSGDTLVSEVPVLLALPVVLEPVTADWSSYEQTQWNVTIKEDSCAASSRIVAGPRITKDPFDFVVSNDTVATQVVACLVNHNRGGWYPFSASDIYTQPFALVHHRTYGMANSIVVHGYESPVVVRNVVRGGRLFLADIHGTLGNGPAGAGGAEVLQANDTAEMDTGGGGIPDSSPYAHAFPCDTTTEVGQDVAAAHGIVFEVIPAVQAAEAAAAAAAHAATDKVVRVKLPAGEWGICTEAVAGSGTFVAAGKVVARAVDVALPPLAAVSACVPFSVQIQGFGGNTTATSLELRSGLNSSGQCCGGLPADAALPPPGQSVVSHLAELAQAPVGTGLVATFTVDAPIQQNLLLCLRSAAGPGTGGAAVCMEAGAIGAGVGDAACFTPEPTVARQDRRIGGAPDPISKEKVNESSLVLIIVGVIVLVVLCLVLAYVCLYKDKAKKKKKEEAKGSKSRVVALESKPLHDNPHIIIPGDRGGGGDHPGAPPSAYSFTFVSLPTEMSAGQGGSGGGGGVQRHDHQGRSILAHPHPMGGSGGGSAKGAFGRPILDAFASPSNPALLAPLPKVQLYDRQVSLGTTSALAQEAVHLRHSTTAVSTPSKAVSAASPGAHPLQPPYLVGSGASPRAMVFGSGGGGGGGGIPPPHSALRPHSPSASPLASSSRGLVTSPPYVPMLPLHSSTSPLPPLPSVYNGGGDLNSGAAASHGGGGAAYVPATNYAARAAAADRYQMPAHVSASLAAGPVGGGALSPASSNAPSPSLAPSTTRAPPGSPLHAAASAAHNALQVQSHCISVPVSARDSHVGREEEVILQRRWGDLLQSERLDFESLASDERCVVALEEEAAWQEIAEAVTYQLTVAETLRQHCASLEDRHQSEHLARLRQMSALQSRTEEAERERRRSDAAETAESDEQALRCRRREAARLEEEQRERLEAQRTLERRTEAALLSDAEETRRDRREGGRCLDRHRADVALDAHRAAGAAQREEAEGRAGGEAEEAAERATLAALAEAEARVVEELLQRVREQAGERQRAQRAQVRTLVGCEAEARLAAGDAERAEFARLGALHAAELHKRRQIRDLLLRQRRLEDERLLAKERAVTETQEMQLRMHEQARAIEQERVALEEDKLMLRAARRTQEEAERQRQAEEDRRVREETALLAARAAEAQADEERIAKERDKLCRQKQGMDAYMRSVATTLRDAEDSVQRSKEEKASYDAAAQEARNDMKGLYLQQTALVQGESRRRRDLEIEAWRDRDRLLTSHQQQSASVLDIIMAKQKPPSPAAPAASPPVGSTVDTLDVQLKNSAVSVLRSLEQLTLLSLR